MSTSLSGKKIAILIDNGFEEVEMTEPRKALEKAGATVDVVSPQAAKVKSFIHDKPGSEFPVDVHLDKAHPDQYDGLVLPGGVANPDHLRTNASAVAFVKSFNDAGKPIAAICHGPWTLIEAGAVKGKQMTSYRSLKTDLTNAGATWTDQEVVVDKGLVTSRDPDDLPAFNAKMVEEFAEGIHSRPGSQAR